MLRGKTLLDDMRRRSDEEIERNRLAAVYLIEATGYESHHLWVDYSEESNRHGWGDARIPRVPWEQVTMGYHKTIGTCARMPVHVSVTFARVRGQIIAFYEATSQVVDRRQVEKWLETEFPASRGRTNPMNFHICLQALEPEPVVLFAGENAKGIEVVHTTLTISGKVEKKAR